jgi:hypothetical protein
MNVPSRFVPVRIVLACALLCNVFSGRAVAGTTGGVSGTVLDQETKAPVAAARVVATSPSQTAAAITDAGGHYAFVSLAPDEYTLTVTKEGYEPASTPGVAVFADATQVVPLSIHKSLKTIANVTSTSAGSLVRSGTTADVYSVNAAQQARTNVLGGGGNLDSAYSAIAAVPGVYVPTSQNGYNQAVHVRGGDSDEVGYEVDGVPVNRGFDNYPSGALSSLGQLELQVYTGATPANAEAQGLAGFINQVIRTGTHPGFGDAELSFGTPTFYHSLNVEAGGATPDRTFSYYFGTGGYNQDYRYVDQFNAPGLGTLFGPILDTCPSPPLPANPPASCLTNGAPNVSQAGAPGFILGPIGFGNNASGVQTRTSVVNLHFAVPHKYNSGRDDIQVLYENDSIQTPLYISPNDEGLNNFVNGFPTYSDSYQYTGPLASFLTDGSASQIVPYYFPSSPANRPFGAPIPLDTQDVQYNNQAIVKVQYQKNFSSDSYLRLYGYTYYSNYIGTGAVSSWQPVTGYDSGDYELSSHTRGLSATFAKQLSPEHLIQAEASYTTSTSLRDFNSQMFGPADSFAVLVNPNDLTSGTCYALSGSPGSYTTAPTTCNSGNTLTLGTPATFASLANSYGGTLTSSAGQPLNSAALAGTTCGGGPCGLYAVENGAYAEYNAVTPVFGGYSLTDEYRPNDKLLVNAGLRLDSYKYEGADTTATPARAFWFNAFNKDTCYDTQDLTLYDKTSLADGSSIPIGEDCTKAGSQYVDANMQNVSGQTFLYNILQPRVGVTYTVSPYTVLRASWGKYNEQPTAAYEQYNGLQQNLTDQLIQYYALGFNTPGHQIAPSISYNTDFSLEHRFKGTDVSLKLTPFVRQTKDQIENFYTNIKAGFISGLNAGNQTSEGFEFALQKGDYNRNGFAGQLSFAYTYAYVKYNALPNGTTILSPINADIQHYNAYTSYCASHPSNNPSDMCYTGVGGTSNLPNGAAAAPCYSGTTPDPGCTIAGSIANPYWNAPPQPILDPNGKYLPYSIIPGGVGTGVNAYTYPYVTTLILNYKHDKLAITPSFQFMAGNRYGAPETMPGIDPAAGCSALAAGTVANDPRYPYGAPGGSPYDATTCAGQLSAIPDSYTGQFDGLGAFREPSQLLGHLRISYDVSKSVSLNLTLANLISTCFGGQQTPFTYYFSRTTCSYGSLPSAQPPVGNVYNPGDNVQPFLRYPYEPDFGVYNDATSSTLTPFSAYFTVKIRM